MILLFLFTIDTLTVAVSDFENLGGVPDTYSKAFPSMLITALSSYGNVKVLEREALRKALEEFKIQTLSGIDPEAFKKIGDWLGADGIITGSLSNFNGKFRADARIIDTRTGIVIAGISCSIRNPEYLPDSIAARLLRKIQKPEENGVGQLEIYFRLTYSPIASGKIYHQLVRLYIDDVYMGTSQAIREIKRWYRIFNIKLKAGKTYKIKLQHGYIDKGKWYGPMELQPNELTIQIKNGEIKTIKYEFIKGAISDRFRFIQ